MPGLVVTLPQAMRLWGVSAHVCRDIVNVLVESAFLQWTPAGKIARDVQV
jgi:hypothetical protein